MMHVTDAELDERFNYHRPSEETAQKHESVREECRELAEFLIDVLPDCRESSLALTKLEEVMFWANAAVARKA